MDTCVLHYDSVENNEKLLCLSSRSAWLTILEAAKVRKYESVAALEENIGENEYPSIKFHKSCRSMFTMKRDLNK